MQPYGGILVIEIYCRELSCERKWGSCNILLMVNQDNWKKKKKKSDVPRVGIYKMRGQAVYKSIYKRLDEQCTGQARLYHEKNIVDLNKLINMVMVLTGVCVFSVRCYIIEAMRKSALVAYSPTSTNRFCRFEPNITWGEEPNTMWGEGPNTTWGEEPNTTWGEGSNSSGLRPGSVWVLGKTHIHCCQL